MLFKRKSDGFNESSIQQKQNVVSDKKSGALREVIAKLARGLMLPISILPIAGLFLGIGSAITSQTTDSAGQLIGKIISNPGSIVYALLPLFFAIAIAITFTNDSGTAALSALLGYGVFVVIQSAIIFEPSGNNPYYHYL
jgi:PTS system glucose-specific IIC component